MEEQRARDMKAKGSSGQNAKMLIVAFIIEIKKFYLTNERHEKLEFLPSAFCLNF